MDEKLAALLAEVRSAAGSVVALTGAGISAESGLPTFRGAEGYWRVGSKNYAPEDMATRAMFDQKPEEVWRWYLYRFGVYRDATPNEGHRALARLEQALGERFTLVTQNIDGLHRRAGSERVIAIHGEAAYVRCADECGLGRVAAPELTVTSKDAPLPPSVRAALTCPRCGGWLRPHVLWFDECYDDENYGMSRALEAGAGAALLLVVGTSGATNLPMQIGRAAARRGVALVDVNPASNPFSELAERSPRGCSVRSTASEALPALVAALL